MPKRNSKIPKKKPRQERAMITVNAIQQAATHILIQHGYDSMNTNRIAEVAGISIGSLYQYFPNKEAIIVALMEQHLDEILKIFDSITPSLLNAPLDVAVRTIVHAMMTHRTNPQLDRILTTVVQHIGQTHHLVAKVEQHTANFIKAFLDARKDQIRHVNMEMAAFLIFHTVYSLTEEASKHPRYSNDERFANEVADLLIRYLSPT